MTGESYTDMDGNPITLEERCRTEPEWASYKIMHLRAALETARRDRDVLLDRVMSHRKERDEARREELTSFFTLTNCANAIEGGEHRKENERMTDKEIEEIFKQLNQAVVQRWLNKYPQGLDSGAAALRQLSGLQSIVEELKGDLMAQLSEFPESKEIEGNAED